MGIVTTLVESTPVVGQAIGFGRTAVKVYNSTTPAGAVSAAVEGIIHSCTPPHVKYSLKCTALLLQLGIAGLSITNPVTGPLSVSLVIGQATSILEESLI